MCIIVFKPYDAEMPSETILDECYWSNPHGAGYMIRRNDGRIAIRKGFMTVNSLLESLDTIKDIDEQDIAIHFRYATHGGKTAGETHPFPITPKIDMLRRRKIVCDEAIMHNGIISNLKHRDETLSDTMCLVKILSGTDEHSEYIQSILNAGKFLIMDRKETRFYGTFIEEKGCYFSNSSFRACRTQYLTNYTRNNCVGLLEEGDKYDKYDQLIGNWEEQENLLEWYNSNHGTRYYDIWDLMDDLEVLADTEDDKEDSIQKVRDELFGTTTKSDPLGEWWDRYDY